MGEVTHVLSHRRMVVTVALAPRRAPSPTAVELAPPYEKSAWLDPKAPGVGVSTLARKVVALALGASRASADENG